MQILKVLQMSIGTVKHLFEILSKKFCIDLVMECVCLPKFRLNTGFWLSTHPNLTSNLIRLILEFLRNYYDVFEPLLARHRIPSWLPLTENQVGVAVLAPENHS
jgi:hypothetical protein